jgi:hypothetical protein
MTEEQTSDHIESIKLARARLETLFADTADQGARHHGFLHKYERQAIRTILDELHRLHLAVSIQAKIILHNRKPQKSPARKPADARSAQPTAHKTRANKGSHRS